MSQRVQSTEGFSERSATYTPQCFSAASGNLGSKIWIVGSPGAGKSYVADRLSASLGTEVVRLDEIFWHPSWTKRGLSEVQNSLAERLAADAWIIDGDYPELAPFLRGLVGTLIWLDMPFPLLLSRILSRTTTRIRTRANVCGGNTETVRKLFTLDSMPIYLCRTYVSRRSQLRSLAQELQMAGAVVLRLRSRRQVEEFLMGLQ